MNILVTGSNGFVGKNLIAALDALRGGINPSQSNKFKNMTINEYNTADTFDELEAYCSDCDFVFNLAGVNRTQNNAEFMSGNLGFAEKLLDTLKRQNNKCPVMLSSSVQATPGGKYAQSEYGKSKRAAEELLFKYAAETGAKALVYRLPHLFGKWSKPNYNSAIATFCHNTANGLPIAVSDPHAVMEIVYIDDLTDEMIGAICGKETRSGSFCRIPVSYTTTLGYIAETISSFPEIRKSLGVPDTADPLINKLYSTWLSYLPPERVIYDLNMNSDSRGSFTEIIRTPERGQFSVSVSKPGITRGDHWHNSKNEKFLVVKGSALILLRRIGKDEQGNSYPVIKFFVSGDKMQIIEMLPGYTHSITNLSEIEDLVTFIWANECFNPDKPDTYSEEV